MSYKLYDAEIEYLESTGTQYIDTGITIVYATDVVEMSLNISITSGSTRQLNGANGFLFFGVNASSKFEVSGAAAGTYNSNFHNWYLHCKAGSKVTGIIDGTSYQGNVVVDTVTYEFAIFLFALGGRDNAAASFFINQKLRNAVIRKNGVVVRDFIPVRIGNVGYLYDKVSGQLFGNSGTGSFVLGSDVAPAAYANEIAFLESTGSQYIDTGINADSNMGFSMTYSFTDLSDGNFSRVGAIRQSGSNYIRHHTTRRGTSNSVIDYMLPTFTKTLADATNKHTLVLDTVNSSIGYDGELTTYREAAFDCNLNYYLFARNDFLNNTASITCAKMKIYQIKIYSNGVLVRDFIPVEYNNIGYLYDKVSGEFFANQGTGKFVLGHRAPRFDGKACARSYTRRQLMMEDGKPPYIQDGLVFWLDGINKGTSDGKWVEKIHGTIFSGNATPTDKGFNFSSGQLMHGSWVNGTSVNFTVEVCYYTTLTRQHFVWGVNTTGTRTPLYMDNNGKIATIQDLNVFARPSSFSLNKTVSINQNIGIYNGVNITKLNSSDWWVASPNGSTANIGKGYAGVASSNPLTGIIYAIRVYNRRLTAEEMLYNQRIDNKRFNLGLNI